jgi:YesN/AraC family two-component response regulator
MALFLSERPEIVITDIFMPEQEGIGDPQNGSQSSG